MEHPVRDVRSRSVLVSECQRVEEQSAASCLIRVGFWKRNNYGLEQGWNENVEDEASAGEVGDC